MSELKLSITPSSICKYYHSGGGGVSRYESFGRSSKSPPKGQIMAKANKGKAKHNPELSPRARKRIRNAVNWLSLLSAPKKSKYYKGNDTKRFKIGFWTLTLPGKQMHSHSKIKSKCLNNFLTVMRQRHQMRNYVWVAELQRNGNIHFHITTDIYVHYAEIRRIWNQSLQLLGYIDEYAKTFQYLTFDEYCSVRGSNSGKNEQNLAKSYEYGQTSRWRNPNTTDVKSVRNVRNLAAYLSKYLSKGEQKEIGSGPYVDSLEEFTGRRWFLSQSVSRLGTVKIDCTMKANQIFNLFKSVKSAFKVERDFIDMVFFQIGALPQMLREFLREELVSHAIDSGYSFVGDYRLILK